MGLVLLKRQFWDELNGVTLTTVRLSLLYDSPQITVLTEWVLRKKEKTADFMSAVLPLLTLRLVLTQTFLTSAISKLFLSFFR